MYYLSIGGMFRQENSWLEEWIQYHLAIGVEHIILYNDDLDTRVSDRILLPYVERGLVENRHIADRSEVIRRETCWSQEDTYRDMIQNAVGQTEWLAILDLDELLLPRQTDDLRELLTEYEEHSGLAVNWAIYGSGGHIKRPPSQIRHFLNRSETHWDRNQFVKSIVRPSRVLMNEPHLTHFFPTKNGETVNENHEPVHGMTHDISTEKIRINHYVLRSWQDFWEVKAMRPRPGNGPCDQEYFDLHDRNEVFDDEIARRFGHILQS